jgi:SAM-dependent methyltransferase
MTPRLQQETVSLTESWMRHDAQMLRTYLVADVEDPRLNLQSILSRHFLVRSLSGDQFEALMEEECRFGIAMNWLTHLLHRSADPDDLTSVLYALEKGADNADGIEIPHFMLAIFAALPVTASGSVISNYVQEFLAGPQIQEPKSQLDQLSLQTFLDLWRAALGSETPSPSHPHLSVLEPACGSANDYRVLHACGLASLVDYAGFDLCPRNIENARALFPSARFDIGNAFEIAAGDDAFDLCMVHDLFEHLSLEGLETAVAEICRVTRSGGCIGFFNMDEIPDHQIHVVQDYHWNRLSMARMRALLAQCGFSAQVIHIGTFLRERFGCDQTHNPNAYTFYLSRRARQ